MNCDIKTVIAILYKQLVSSSVSTYPALIDMLFKSYFDDPTSPEYDRSEPSKLNAGTRTLSSNITDFYVRKDKAVLLGDIQRMLKYILDKPQLHVSFFDLIINDQLISKPFKKQFGLSNSREYSDDEHLAEVFYTAVTIAAYRPYYKVDKYWFADYYFDPNSNTGGLFSKAKPKAPPKHFTGREKELDELHTLMQTEGKVFVTGVAGVGKSELVRTYAKKYASEYAHIGYYNYNEYHNSISDIIANILPNMAFIRSDIEALYEENLELLSSFGKNLLLIIDNYNVPADHDSKLPDLLELECDIIFISYSHYDDDFTVYDLTEFRTFHESYDLIKQFYPFDENDPDVKFKMHRLALITDKYPFSLELCARSMKRGTDTPDTCADALVGGIKNMKARIPANKDRIPKTDTHYRHIESLFRKADLTVTDKYVLSYMRFMPESGVPKMLFQKLTRLIDFTEIDKLSDLGFIHDNSDGTISISSIVRKLVEADYEINPEEMLAFGETLFAMDASEASKDVLAEIAGNISPLKYLLMIESDVFVAYHLLFQFYFKLERNFDTDMALSCLAMYYNKNIFKHRLMYQSDKAQFFERIKDAENFEFIKQALENTETNPRWHAHEDGKEPPSEPLVRSFLVSEEEDAEIFGLNDE